MVNLARLVALDHEGRERAQLLGDEPVVDSADSEQHRNRHALGSGGRVREHKHAAAGEHGRLRLGDDAVEGRREPLARREGDVDPVDLEPLERLRVEEEALQLDAAGRLRAFDEQR